MLPINHNIKKIKFLHSTFIPFVNDNTNNLTQLEYRKYF